MKTSTTGKQGPVSGVPSGSTLRVLCGGVPFGANNIGDEGILHGIVRMIREVAPGADITAATADPDTTARLLKVRTCPSFGFGGVPAAGPEVERMIAGHDVFIWSGATGLSDYPDIPLGLLQTAKRLNKCCIVLCVGMSDRFNPHLYQVRSRWRPAYDRIHRWTGGLVNLAGWLEASRKRKTAQRLREILPQADLVVVRDLESEETLRRLGVPGEIFVGTDAALKLAPAALAELPVPEPTRGAISATDRPRVGLCLSAQDPPHNLSVVAAALDRVLANTNAVVFGIPINFVTDAKLMNELRPQIKAPERMQVIESVHEPEDVAGLIGQMDVIVSSRLHALIFGSLSDTPLVGIRRGTKIDAFLSPYRLQPAGDFHDLTTDELERHIRDRLADAPQFRPRAAAVRQDRLRQLETVAARLKAVLERVAA